MDLATLRRHWNELGRRDPLWAVLSDDSRRGGLWDPDEFFLTGVREIENLLVTLEALGRPAARRHALDFGCGVGRVTQALARHFSTCTGVDLSASMLREAERFNRHGIRCRYVLNERRDLEVLPAERFDLVYSVLVLQHMVPDLSRGYLTEFLRVTAPGGVVAFQLPSHPAEPDTGLALPAQACVARIELRDEGLPGFRAGESGVVPLRVTNVSPEAWPDLSGSRFPLRVGNCWRDAAGRPIRFDDGRAAVRGAVEPGGSRELDLVVTAPDAPGEYLLECDVVQEFVAWFRAMGSPTMQLPVVVASGGAATPGPAVASEPPAQESGQVPDPEAGGTSRGGARAVWRRLRSSLRARLRRGTGLQEPRMEMYGVPREEVETLLRRHGGRLLRAEEDFSAPGFVSYRYFVTRD